MIQVTPHMKVLIAVAPIDFRKGIDGIAQLCRHELATDPFSGTVFVFRNRRATAVKLLVYDGRKFWLCHGRLSTGKFRAWPSVDGDPSVALEPHELGVLLCAGDPTQVITPPVWRPVGDPAGTSVPQRRT